MDGWDKAEIKRMSSIEEYIKLIPKGIPHSLDILESIVNGARMKLGNLPKDQLEEIVRRRFICSTCPFMSKNATTSPEYLSLTGNSYTTERTDEHCAFCGCSTSMRTRALDAVCGASSWNDDHPDNEISLKWTKYDKNEKK